MIYIIGTEHSKTQFWSDAIRQGISLDTCPAIVEAFEDYLREVATAAGAPVIAEENSQYCVDQMEGGASVAAKVAEGFGLRHVYCDPDREERIRLSIKSLEEKERVWLKRLQAFSPNKTSIIFICGADHCRTFQALLQQNGLKAQIHCENWVTEHA